MILINIATSLSLIDRSPCEAPDTIYAMSGHNTRITPTRLNRNGIALIFRYWHIAIFGCTTKIGRNRGIADTAGAAVGSTRSRLTRLRMPADRDDAACIV